MNNFIELLEAIEVKASLINYANNITITLNLYEKGIHNIGNEVDWYWIQNQEILLGDLEAQKLITALRFPDKHHNITKNPHVDTYQATFKITSKFYRYVQREKKKNLDSLNITNLDLEKYIYNSKEGKLYYGKKIIRRFDLTKPPKKVFDLLWKRRIEKDALGEVLIGKNSKSVQMYEFINIIYSINYKSNRNVEADESTAFYKLMHDLVQSFDSQGTLFLSKENGYQLIITR